MPGTSASASSTPDPDRTCGARCDHLTSDLESLCQATPQKGTTVKLSTRNQLPGTVTSVTLGEAMAVVRIQLDGGAELTSSITRDAVEDLELSEGSKVIALVKSTEVALAIE
jgi:molybdopterin-binding protein